MRIVHSACEKSLAPSLSRRAFARRACSGPGPRATRNHRHLRPALGSFNHRAITPSLPVLAHAAAASRRLLPILRHRASETWRCRCRLATRPRRTPSSPGSYPSPPTLQARPRTRTHTTCALASSSIPRPRRTSSSLESRPSLPALQSRPRTRVPPLCTQPPGSRPGRPHFSSFFSARACAGAGGGPCGASRQRTPDRITASVTSDACCASAGRRYGPSRPQRRSSTPTSTTTGHQASEATRHQGHDEGALFPMLHLHPPLRKSGQTAQESWYCCCNGKNNTRLLFVVSFIGQIILIDSMCG